MKKIFTVAFVALLAVLLVACGKKETKTTGYGLVHGHYVARVDLTINDKGKIKSAKIEEYFLPYSWAKVAEGTTGALAYDYKGAVNWYAPFIAIDGELYTAVQTGNAPVIDEKNPENNVAGTRVVNYFNSKNVNIEDVVKKDADAKKYVDALLSGKAFIANEDGTKSSVASLDANFVAGKHTKTAANYWPAGGVGKGWKANMDAIVASLVGSDASGTPKQNADKTWSIGDIKSGATVTDFADYWKVAKVAFDKK